MTLTQKFLILVVSLIVLFSGTVYVLHQKFTLAHFYQLEQEQRLKDVQRTTKEIKAHSTQLFQLLYEWSAWDESYEFTKTANKAFIEGNLLETSVDRMALQSMVWINLDFDIVWSQYSKQPLAKGIAPEQLNAYLIKKAKNYFASHQSTPLEDQGIHNFVRYQDSYFFFAIRPMIKSNNSGPVAGYLIFTQRFDDKFIEQMKKNLFLNLTLTAPEAKLSPNVYPIIDANDPDVYKLTKLIQGQDSSDTIEVTLTSSREMVNNAQQSINDSVLLTIFSGMIMLIILTVTLHIAIVLPISRSTKLINRIIKTRDYTQKVDIRRHDEIGFMQLQFNRLLAQVNRQNEQLIKLATVDTLTGLANRRALENFLEAEWQRGAREQTPVSIVMCDIDLFKQYNDNYGHQQGDRCLQQFAKILSSSEHRKSDLTARYGGEEFMLVLPNTDTKGAKVRAQRLQKELAEAAIPHEFSGVSEHVTVSIGIATATPSTALKAEKLIKHADKQLYLAKENGRNQLSYTLL